MARTSGSRSDITRLRLRKAAASLFARHGYAAVSMRQIAAEVGVQVGALYLHTADKQALLFDLLREHMEELLSAWAGEVKGSTASEELAALVAFHLRFNLERRDAVFISYMELRNLEEDNFAVIEGMRREYERMVEEILLRGCREGAFVLDDARIAALGLIALLTGPNTWFRAGGRLDLEELTATYLRMAFRLVGVPGTIPAG